MCLEVKKKWRTADFLEPTWGSLMRGKTEYPVFFKIMSSDGMKAWLTCAHLGLFFSFFHGRDNNVDPYGLANS